MNVRVFDDSVKFYLPRVEGYLELVREMASKYRGMSLIEFDGYFEGRMEPAKYTRVEIHTNDFDEGSMRRLFGFSSVQEYWQKSSASAYCHGSYMQPQFINETSRQILIDGIRTPHNLYIPTSCRLLCP